MADIKLTMAINEYDHVQDMANDLDSAYVSMIQDKDCLLYTSDAADE